MKSSEKDEIVKSYSNAILKDDLTQEQFRNITITIPPHSNSIGINTTQLFKQLDSAKQYGHGIKVIPSQRDNTYGYHYDPNRSLRQQDVAVTAISDLTEKRWRADVDNTTKVITLSTSKKYFKWVKKNRHSYINDLQNVLRHVTSEGTEIHGV